MDKRRDSLVDDFDAIRKRMRELHPDQSQPDAPDIKKDPWLRWNLYFQLNPSQADGASSFWRHFSREVGCQSKSGVCVSRDCLKQRECQAAKPTASLSIVRRVKP